MENVALKDSFWSYQTNLQYERLQEAEERSEIATMNSNYGSEFIVRISVFECQLCQVFLRHQNDIKKHIDTIKHLASYKKILKGSHDEHAYSKQNNVVEQDSSKDQDSFHNRLLKDTFDEHAYSKQRHLDEQGLTTDRASIRNVYDDSHDRKSCLGVRNTDEVKENHIGESDSDQRMSDSSERCNTSNEIGEGGFQGRLTRTGDTNVGSVKLDERMSITELNTRQTYPCDILGTYFQGTQVGAYTATKIKQEEEDNDVNDNDFDDLASLIGRFLEDSDDYSQIDGGHCNVELMSGYTKDNTLMKLKDNVTLKRFQKPQSFMESNQISPEILLEQPKLDADQLYAGQNQKLLGSNEEKSFPTLPPDASPSLVDDRSYPAFVSRSESQSQSDVSFEVLQSQRDSRNTASTISEDISTTVREMKMDNDKDVNLNSNAGVDTDDTKNGPNQRLRRKPLRMPMTLRNRGKDESHVVSTTQNSKVCVADESKSLTSQIFTAYDKDLATEMKSKIHSSVDTNKELYSCVICGKVFSTGMDLELHLSNHAGKKAYSCNICCKSFDQQGDLKAHETIHTEKKSFSCEVCHKAFTVSSRLHRHMRIHSGEKPFFCDICGKAFALNWNLKAHKRIHTGEKPFACGICEKAFNDNCTRNRHMRTHTGEKPFACDTCGKEFSQSWSLKTHKRIHTGEKPCSCNICGKAFTVLSTLLQHKRIHSGEKPFTCEICGKAFTMSESLKKHKRIHTGEKPFACDVCGKAFTDSYSLKIHKRVHTGERPFACDACGKAFSDSRTLKTHKRIHTGEKPFSCNICGKSFTAMETLKQHRRIHIGIRPYLCNICWKAFAVKGKLKEHKRIHTGEKPFTCDVCEKVFALSSYLRLHKKRVHIGAKTF